MSLIHRASVALVSTALAVSLASAGQPAQAAAPDSPAGHGATWLAGQLSNKNLIHNRQFHFDDYGLTIDTAFALEKIGGHRSDVARIRTALSKHVASYTTGVDFGSSHVYTGAVAKLAVLAQSTGGGARSFGGTNLVHELAKRVSTAAPMNGRIQDTLDGDSDTANVLGQVFAVRALLAAGSDAAGPALHFLLDQQCPGGSFRVAFTSDTTAAQQGCTSRSLADTDVTGLAVVELWDLRAGHAALREALRSATGWLIRHQEASGAIKGGPNADANSNSTGVSAWALGTAGKCRAAGRAASFLAKRQVAGPLAGTPLAGERGAIAYDKAAMTSAKQDGITTTSRDQWRRSTTQAAPALTFLSAKACG